MDAQAFREAMAALPTPPPSSPPHWPYWQANMQRMGTTRALETFWDWPAIRHTMTVDHFPMGHQLLELQCSADWRRWEAALSYAENEHHAKNLINQAFCLHQWESASGRHVEDLLSIYEFGAGYGAMRHLCDRLGFAGHYFVTDLPEFALLQDWWLGTHGLAVEHVAEPVHADLCIGLYSISETAADYRDKLCAKLTADSYLLLFSEKWAEWDNRAFFEQFVSQRNGLTWSFPRYLERPDFFALGW